MNNKKAIAIAPKFVLHITGAGYLSNHQGLTGVNFTHDLQDAEQYAVGFDDPKQKLEIWNAAAKRMFNNAAVQFEIVYL